ncbi:MULTISPECIES: HAMP domain-containing sensor histidine kinase [unclassified Leptolyngbya]|uniref:GAF domain-containing sensor histidine kinase n=1 Tax=unclassified Leptolyngbya TaxID=2650499 RepID=UPI001686A905|nr:MULTISPECIES: HAMP domain-containing sensor histidine kinase [unclassified Leptolyngbya]MBD1912019.1 HAMP domain-containing histidine kinase [Leptolyngbya sp. FACHB-8]MBD2155389.1 HAMP domain-containing histidine kinase [Leptolyngbya sp. FACHB-16]
MFASPDFVTLCQAQIALLTQGLGAALSVVYLTEEVAGDATANLVPIAAHPDTIFSRDPASVFSLLALDASDGLHPHPSHKGEAMVFPQVGQPVLPGSPNGNAPEVEAQEQTSIFGMPLPMAQRMMVPLVHEGVVLGLLVTARSDRPWGEVEQDQIERVARTLAIACVMDRRAAWNDHSLHQLQQLQAQQHELFDNLLHQFRNPLMALRTFGKVLLKRLAPNNKSRDLAEGIVRESEHLQDLLKQFEQVVDLQPVELLPGQEESHPPENWRNNPKALASSTGVPLLPGVNALTPAQLQPIACELTDILQPLLNSARAIAQDRRLQLLILIPEGVPAIEADPGALREAFNNLIDNALKYTPSGGKVEVLAGLRRQRNGINFQGLAIIDNGPGIPQGDQTRLFERHFRGIQATSDIPGTGLGLAITHDLIQRMRGEVEAFSPAGASGLLPDEEDGDRGTAFIVWLPEASH